MLLNVAADFFGRIRLRITAGRSRAASQTRAKSRIFRQLRTCEESHIFPPRSPRRARWTAVHAGTGDGENKLSVPSFIARKDSVPAGVVSRKVVGPLSRERIAY